jgi:3',5'-cyclic AMP phosphodiesterase CpdA
MSLRIAHISDSHFGTINDTAKDALVVKLRELVPDIVILSGDITQRARKAQFKAAWKFTQELAPIPNLAIPGNHDIPLFNVFGRLLRPYFGYRRYFQHNSESTTTIKDVWITGVNSTSRWRHVQGSLNGERFKKNLEKVKPSAQIRIVAIHHPLDCAKRVDDKNILRNGASAISTFGDAKIDLILSGHVHDPFTTLSSCRYPETKRSMVIAVAGTCISTRTRKDAPNSFNFVEIQTEKTPAISVHRMDLSPGGEFKMVDKTNYIRAAEARWVLI